MTRGFSTGIPWALISGLALWMAFAAEASSARAAELHVSAAASLSDALQELGKAYTAKTRTDVLLNLGASGTLARQIEAGAPADVFLSADEARMDQLEKAGLLEPHTRRELLANTLVVVVPAKGGVALTSPKDLAEERVRRIALGDPALVPAGTYAQEYLDHVGLWAGVKDKVVPLQHVRAVLAAVEAGNADAGFVYRTDAAISKRVRIALEIPRAEGPAITYPAVVLRAAKAPDEARAFLAFLSGNEARLVWERFGFIVLPTRAEAAPSASAATAVAPAQVPATP